jgi:uncharacterized protein (DUF736 family)
MAYEHKNNRGSIFRNKNKKTPNSPDLSGDGVRNNEKVKIAGWDKTTKDGREYIYLSLEDFDAERPHIAEPKPVQAAPKMRVPVLDDNSDLPF